MLASRGMSSPDCDRPLYKYHLTLEEAASLERLLIDAFQGSLPRAPTSLGAAYCFWVSYWFQKRFSGGSWSWHGPATDVGAPNDPSSRTDLIKEGMRYLRREIIVKHGVHEYLLTLISEAGFPCSLISEERNWLTRYTEAVTLAASQGELSLSRTADHAEFYQFLIPPSFRAPNLFEVTANLAFQVAKLRRLLSQQGVREGAVEWLNNAVPNWRDELPITADDSAARLLVEGLVRIGANKSVMPVSCQRILHRRINSEWVFGLRMTIEGRIEDSDLPSNVRVELEGINRARILPAGILEKAGLPAIGVANRIVEQKAWEVESLLGRGPTDIKDFPLNEDARLIFSVTGRNGVEFIPRGGTRITSDIIVFRHDGPETGNEIPSSFVMIGSGSVKDREERLFVAAPKQAVFTATDGSSIQSFGEIGNYKLFVVMGAAEIKLGEDYYVVSSGADTSESACLEAVGPRLQGGETDLPAYLGCPDISVQNGNVKLSGSQRNLRMRISGNSRAWMPFNLQNLPYGKVDVAAIDNKGKILDRLTFIHFPQSAYIKITIPRERHSEILISGIDGGNIDLLCQPDDGFKIKKIADGRYDVAFMSSAISNHKLRVRLRWADSEAVISIPILSSKLAFYKDDGSLIHTNSVLSLSSLRGASIESVENAIALITLRGRNLGNHPPFVERYFERSLPFSQIRDDISLLLSMTNDLDAEVLVEALHGGTTKSKITVRRFDISLSVDGNGTVSLSEESKKILQHADSEEFELFGRPFLDITGQDRKLARFIDANEIHWEVEDGQGAWFVYVKSNGITMSRPLSVPRNHSTGNPAEHFYEAISIPDREERKFRIKHLLETIGNGSDIESLKRLISLIESIDSTLPLQAFDILRMIPEKPTAAVQMAAFYPDTSEISLRAILDLDQNLPLDWLCTDPRAWCESLKFYRWTYKQKLSAAGLPEDSVEKYADEHLRARAQEISYRRPGLSVHMAITMKSMNITPDSRADQKLQDAMRVQTIPSSILTTIMTKNLQEIASTARKSNEGRRWPSVVNFRQLLTECPFQNFEAPNWASIVLDAPLAAATIALGSGSWTYQIERSLRICKSFDPVYFEDAYLCAMSIGWAQTKNTIGAAKMSNG
jgi:hypothetical protein